MKEAKIISLIFLMIFLMGIISAITCCERTVDDFSCVNVGDDEVATRCDGAYRSDQTFCEITDYCQEGTCVDQEEGRCISTPKVVCEDDGGYWSSQSESELLPCQLGCCLIGDQAHFITQVACNAMASRYGFDVDPTFRLDISVEEECQASANAGDEGACVYTSDYIKTCERTTRAECQERGEDSDLLDVSFHAGFLCSAKELNTECGTSCSGEGTNLKCETTCEGDDVYFVDSCGNLANIYNTEIADDETQWLAYWTYIEGYNGLEVTCGDGNGNEDSATCGDCEYNLGTSCGEKEKGDVVDTGDYMCKTLDCVDYRGAYPNGENGVATATNYPKHGESWCVYDTMEEGVENILEESGVSEYSNVGTSHFKMTCYNGEVLTPYECDPYRQLICAQETTPYEDDVFYTANCKVNMWFDCYAQNTSSDCRDETLRHCEWITGSVEDSTNFYFTGEGLKTENENKNGVCVPRYAPAFERDDNEDVIGGEVCYLASSVCMVKLERSLVWSWANLDYDCVDNCSCLDDYDEVDGYPWKDALDAICSSMGDCGNSTTNFVGRYGQPQDIFQVIELEHASDAGEESE